MKVWIAALVAALTLAHTSTPALAQDSREIELARDIIELAEIDRPMIQMIEHLAPLVSASLRSEGQFSEEDIARFEEIFREEFETQLPAILDVVAQTYARRFNEAELTEIRDFFRSAVGRRWAEMQIEMMSDIEADMVQHGEDVAARTFARFQTYIQQKDAE